jgi:NAD(P)H-flavin reductase
MENPYIPYLAVITDIRDETVGERAIKTFRIAFQESHVSKNFTYKPGQCAMLGILGKGESMISINSLSNEDYLQFSVMKMGKVTSQLHECEVGDTVTVRGPYGNGFPIEDWKGKNVISIGGGIGQAPLRPIINYILNRGEQYGKLTLIYGARTASDLCFKEELSLLKKHKGLSVYLSIDRGEDGWKEFIGFVPDNLLAVHPSPENAIAVTCGPPIMIKFVIANLLKLGFRDEQIFTTIENRMKCGMGKCGRCNVGNLYACKDGPVFSYATLKGLLD